MAAITAPAIAARAGWNTNVQFPIYQKSCTYRLKRWNGTRMWWHEQTPAAYTSLYFCGVNGYGYAINGDANGVNVGIAPAFCVA